MKSIHWSNAVLDHGLQGGAYLALCSGPPTEGKPGPEIVGSGYKRQRVLFDPAAEGATRSAAEVLFPIALDAWGSIQSFALYDKETGGEPLYFDTLAPVTISAGQRLAFDPGSVVITEG